MDSLHALRESLYGELTGNILPFWLEKARDRDGWGHFGWIDADGHIDPQAPRGGVLAARILWAYSAAARLLGTPQLREAARSAYHDLVDHFHDREQGGFHWMLDVKGNAIDDRKQIYAQAFAVYALAEYADLTGEPRALDLARQTFRLVKERAVDPVHGGYLEARDRFWHETAENRLSSKDQNSPKSMNTHLHVLEAWTRLYRVDPSPDVREALAEALDWMCAHVVDGPKNRMQLYFGMDWSKESDKTSFGHDIEGSWLLYEAAEALGEAERLADTGALAVRMAEEVLEHGLDREYGGLYNEIAEGRLETEKIWWVQAEALVGFFNAWQLSGENRFLDAALNIWHFIDRFGADHKGGEWFWETDREGRPIPGRPKVEPWKCPYHNVRACLEMIRRIDQGEGNKEEAR